MAGATLRGYAVFHLNLAFSSIEEEHRATVIERCYRPLLELARRRGLPLGLEATGYTLEAVATIAPDWIAALRALVHEGTVEFVGSGYAQLIGPLVPADVVRANLRFGDAVYQRLLGVRPRIALVNEQAWSASLVDHYREAGYEAVIMEWDNPRAAHPEWPSEWRYYPQRAFAPDGATTIPVLWNHSIAFQKFQRYAHGELELDEYLDYLRCHRGSVDRVLAIYGSDAEIFDYRPGRYRSEAALAGASEWARLDALFARLAEEPGIAVVSPREALRLIDCPGGGNAIRLESADKPIPVKKQPKYGLARWVVTGRDDLGINTACWRIHEALRRTGGDEAAWRELCYLWSSDFRTHITPRRWAAYVERLAAMERRVSGCGAVPVEDLAPAEDAAPAETALAARDAVLAKHSALVGGAAVMRAIAKPVSQAAGASWPDDVRTERQGRFFVIETEAVRLRLNCRRGLAIDALAFPAVDERPLCGSLPHGYFDDIDWSADQYTGFLVFAAPEHPQVTDLEPAEPAVRWDAAGARVVVSGRIPTPRGDIEKHIVVHPADPAVEIRYRLQWDEIPLGTLRLGHVTLLPSAFDPASLYVATHNGGTVLERFPLDREVDHLAPVSHLVSCRAGLGATEGVIVLGDAAKALQVEVDRTAAALLPLVTMRRIGDQFFARVTLSARELDDTSRREGTGRSRFVDEFRLAIRPVLND